MRVITNRILFFQEALECINISAEQFSIEYNQQTEALNSQQKDLAVLAANGWMYQGICGWNHVLVTDVRQLAVFE